MKTFLTSHIRRTDATIKQLNFWDIGLLKIGCVLFGLLLAKLIPAILGGPIWIYVAAVLVIMLPVAFRFLSKFAAVK